MNEADLCEEDINELQKAITAIATMSSSDFKILLPLLQNRTIKKEDYILKEGDVCRNIFFLLNGFVRMYYVDFDGNEISYRFTDKGNFFVDFQSLLTQQPSRYYWQATQDSELLVFSYQEVQQVYKKSPAWNNFGRLMAERVYLQLNERVDMLLFMKPEEKYLHVLAKQPQLLNQVSLFHLTSYPGIKPESLSRIRKRLSQK